jgi:O-antigen ligase
VEARRPRSLELGLFLLVVALPLAFTPFTSAPFADLKLFALTAGALAVWCSGLPIDRRLALVAAIFVVVTAAAALAGVQPSSSLLASTTGEGGGLVLTICVATLLVAGASLPGRHLSQMRRWLGWSGVVVSLIGIAFRIDPHALTHFGGEANGVSLIGATMGNQIFSGTFDAAALAAVLGDFELSRWRRLGMAFVISVGIGAAGERSSLVLPVVVLAALIWRARRPLRYWVAPVILVVAVIGGWQVLNPHMPRVTDVGALQQFSSSATDRQRLILWQVLVPASLKRPVLGWGPDTTKSANFATASERQITEATLGYADAHNIFIETLVTTGILGLLSLLAIGVVVVPRALRSPPDRAWLFAIAAALGAYSLIEPLNLVLTPLLFLSVGAAAGTAPAVETQERSAIARLARFGSIATGLALAIALLASIQIVVASGFEQQGTVYSDEWAYRIALDIQPWRLSAIEGLARLKAQDPGHAAAQEATSMMADAVGDNPWDTSVRLFAAQVQTLLGDHGAAESYLADQLRRFPGDVAQVINRRDHPPGLSTSL